MSIFDRLLHRVPWNGDKIRLHRDYGPYIERFIGEFYLKIQSGEVYVRNHGYIRRDLPKWSTRFGCWEYTYTQYSGS